MIDADDPHDVAVVADHGVGIASKARIGQRAVIRQIVVIAVDLDAGAAENVVVSVRPRIRIGEAEEGRGTTDQIILAEAAEYLVVAATAFDIVLAVSRPVKEASP
ncbi:hypothetical protein AJ88_20775 [Mesorhizobium amorphae CCBAU 01583]|nr:hypothetical protein AJ88_20775 [Mesorhizobium amorphae CCBAU 01583]